MDDDQIPSGGGEAQPPASNPSADIAPIIARLDRVTSAVETIQSDAERRRQQERVQRISSAEHQINTRIANADRAVAAAEASIAQAFDEGDGATMSSAQRKLSEAIAARTLAQTDQAEFRRMKAEYERRSGGSSGAPSANNAPSEPQKDTKNLDDWRNKHSSWYRVDAELTRAAHEVDQEIRSAGVHTVGSKAYFDEIDRRMAAKYPEKFRSTPSTSSGAGGGNPDRGGVNTGRIPKSVLDGWRRMGIDVDDPKSLQRMVSNREHLAKKGILSEKPQYGEVRI